MSKRLNISFKENDRDIKLLIEINQHGDKSSFIKECVQYFLEKHKAPKGE